MYLLTGYNKIAGTTQLIENIVYTNYYRWQEK